MNKIPKIIHQIWGGEKELPKSYQILSETWRRDYPDWQYEFWDDKRINEFVLKNYPEYYDQFLAFPHNMQRWDSVRYFIMEQIGGMYVDFDFQSIKPITPLIQGQECCFALDPETHCGFPQKVWMLNAALMLSIPHHWFVRKIIKEVFSKQTPTNDKRPKSIQIFTSAGPWMLIDLYYRLNTMERNKICLLSDKYVSPFDCQQSQRYIKGEMSEEESRLRLRQAYAVHYFFGDWR